MKFTVTALVLAAAVAVSGADVVDTAAAEHHASPTECTSMLTKTDPTCGDLGACVAALPTFCERMPQELQWRCARARQVQEGALTSLCTQHAHAVEHVIDVATEWVAYARAVVAEERRTATELLTALGGPQSEAEVAEAKAHAAASGIHHPSFFVDHPSEYVRRNAQAVMDANERKRRGELRAEDVDAGLVGVPTACEQMPKQNPTCAQLQACSKELGPFCPTLPAPYKKQCMDGAKALKGVIKQTCK